MVDLGIILLYFCIPWAVAVVAARVTQNPALNDIMNNLEL